MSVDVSELEIWIKKVESAANALPSEAIDCLEEIGETFLDLVQDNIMKAKNVDTRLLLSSFSRGSANNIWKMDNAALSLTVGSAVDYASYVNEGHSQKPGRFIPGVWRGDRFVYTPGAKTGMVLKASYVEGSYFFDNAEDEIRHKMNDMVEDYFKAFWKKYMGG